MILSGVSVIFIAIAVIAATTGATILACNFIDDKLHHMQVTDPRRGRWMLYKCIVVIIGGCLDLALIDITFSLL